MPTPITTVEANQTSPDFVVYYLELECGQRYIGFTRRLLQRLAQHWQGSGARVTKSCKPVRMIAAISVPDMQEARRLEHELARDMEVWGGSACKIDEPPGSCHQRFKQWMEEAEA